MKQIFISLCALVIAGTLSAQDNTENGTGNYEKLYSKPKLVVGIVVDQMRYDYLTRFWERYGDGGFRELAGNGFNLKNNHFNYIPTYTGPGHASVYTGAPPSSHGIIGNNWYDKFEEESVYCAGDSSVTSVGTGSSAGKMSPHRMLTTSVADENRLHTQMQGKTIGVAIKDRGSILPAGHTANGAYWFQGQDEGKWISSSFYIDELPRWVREFNSSNKAASYLRLWEPLHDLGTYAESGEDINSYEGGFKGMENAAFPYDLKALSEENGRFEIIKSTPFGNSLTTDFAIAAIEGEELGQDQITDFLTLSYSSTDYVGHNFGVNSKEVQDTYLRLDLELERLLEALNEKVGEENYTIFLTSDHGGVHVPSYLQSVRIPSGYFNSRDFARELNEFISGEFGRDDLILNISNYQVFFDYDKLAASEVESEELQKAIAHYALQYDQVNMTFTREQLGATSFTEGMSALIDRGFHQKRSGDVILVLEPSVISYSTTGSTHGSGQKYDTHAPLIFYGQGINNGSSLERTEIIDIAPTISALLGISFPNGSTGRPLEMVIRN